MRLLFLFLLFFPTLATAADPMHFVYYDSYRPRSWEDNGKMRGILVDVIDEAIGKTIRYPLLPMLAIHGNVPNLWLGRERQMHLLLCLLRNVESTLLLERNL